MRIDHEEADDPMLRFHRRYPVRDRSGTDRVSQVVSVDKGLHHATRFGSKVGKGEPSLTLRCCN